MTFAVTLKLLRTVALVSAVLLLGCCAFLWYRSGPGQTMDIVERPCRTRTFTTWSAGGTLYAVSEPLDPPQEETNWKWRSLSGVRRFGISVRSVGLLPQGRLWVKATGPEKVVIAPYWFLCLLFAAYPATAGARSLRRWLLRRARAARNACLACGYDLRGTPGKCPECGTGTSLLPPDDAPGQLDRIARI
jgi:hypothetical protein